ncbi:MAG: hypothetical protein AAGD25_06970 [Cyanobacteria bacterium P01_F01_bin.150]
MVFPSIHQTTDRGIFTGVHLYPTGFFLGEIIVYTEKPCITMQMGLTPNGLTSIGIAPSATTVLLVIPVAATALGDLPIVSTDLGIVPIASSEYDECDH